MMFSRRAVLLLILLASQSFGQTTTLNLGTQGRNADFSKFSFTRPLTQGSILPPTCQVGQLFFHIAAPIGTNVFSCASPNTWAGVGSGYSYTLPQATSSTLGGVMVGSGLAVVSGTLSAIFGNIAGTAAAGNDSRITGALQSSNNLSDITNMTAVLQNLKLTGANAVSISASTTGNAATATRLAVLPTGCLSGQYATGIAASGNAICAQIQYSQLGNTPADYTLPAATATALGGVIAGSGLAVLSGTLSVRVGTSSGTVAAGNDTRITGALQTARNLADLPSVTAALQNLKLTGSSTETIASSTSGNAATASSLQGTGPFRIVGGTNPAMVVQSCGVSPNIDGSDSAGSVTVGSGTVTSCTIPFASAFANAPICTANDSSKFLVLKPTATATSLILSAQSSFGGDVISYICIGK